MDLYCLSVFFPPQQPPPALCMRIIRYQGIVRRFSFWWVWDFDIWWLVSYSTCCGVFKPFYPAYVSLVCFKYKNNLADAWVNISLGCSESLTKKLVSILSCVSQWLGFKAVPLRRSARTARVKFTLFRCVPRNRRQLVNGSTWRHNAKEKQEQTMQNQCTRQEHEQI